MTDYRKSAPDDDAHKKNGRESSAPDKNTGKKSSGADKKDGKNSSANDKKSGKKSSEKEKKADVIVLYNGAPFDPARSENSLSYSVLKGTTAVLDYSASTEAGFTNRFHCGLIDFFISLSAKSLHCKALPCV